MPTPLNQAHIQLILNNHRFEGWSTDQPAVELPDIDMFEVEVGRDGTHYLNGTGMQGGEVTVKLLPTSRSAKQVIQWMTMQLRTQSRIDFSGTYGDPALSFDVVFRGGTLITARPGSEAGRMYEAKFDFEQIIPNYDAARFDPAPQVMAG